jgi:PhnB protein
MSKLNMVPYINFNDHAREAMEFYQRVLGGKLDLLTWNPDGPPKPAEPGDRILHSVLETDGAFIMATDGMEGSLVPVGQNISITLSGPDRDRLEKAFEELSEGGKVSMPLHTESWGDTFGMLVDQFGISWMVNIDK